MSDRFDWLLAQGKIDRVQVYFSLPNSSVPDWCDEAVNAEYEKLETLIDYTRDALSYSNYIESTTEYACQNYALNL